MNRRWIMVSYVEDTQQIMSGDSPVPIKVTPGIDVSMGFSDGDEQAALQTLQRAVDDLKSQITGMPVIKTEMPEDD